MQVCFIAACALTLYAEGIALLYAITANLFIKKVVMRKFKSGAFPMFSSWAQGRPLVAFISAVGWEWKHEKCNVPQKVPAAVVHLQQ